MELDEATHPLHPSLISAPIYAAHVSGGVILWHHGCWWLYVYCFLDDLGYEDLASDDANDSDNYKYAIESRTGNTLNSSNKRKDIVVTYRQIGHIRILGIGLELAWDWG